MEVEGKIKELEDEFKVLKAEIRNVLLDIREVILERSNPLSETPSAFLQIAPTPTSRASAESGDGAYGYPDEADDLTGTVQAEASVSSVADSEVEMTDSGGPATPNLATNGHAVTEDNAPETLRVFRRGSAWQPEVDDGRMSREAEGRRVNADQLAPLSANGKLSEWLIDAIETIGPQELERVIAIHRLWGNLPPNLSRALAYVQELLDSADGGDLRWLKVMQQLDKMSEL